MDVVQFGPLDDLGYRRPPVTASYDDLRRRGLPEVLLVHSSLPEGVTVCDVQVFAAMIEEAYHPPRALLVNPPDEEGTEHCRGFVGNGLWEWVVASPTLRSDMGLPSRPSLWLTLAPERDGQRQASIATRSTDHDGRRVVGPVLATFPLSTRPSGWSPPSDDSVELRPLSLMRGRKYRRPPATVSLDDLGRRSLPTVLFVNRHLPEGVTVCDIEVFAAMIEEAYRTPGALHVLPDLDEHGNEQCAGIGSTGTWEWLAVSESEPDYDEWGMSTKEWDMSATAEIRRILFAPEADGKRVCTLRLVNGNGGRWLKDNHPVTFTIRVHPGPAAADRGAAADDRALEPAALEPVIDRLADQDPGAADLLRLLAFLGPEPLSLDLLLAGARAVIAATHRLPGPQAAAVVGTLPADPAAAGHAVTALRCFGLLSPAGGGREVISQPVRVATRARLTAHQAAFWRQAAAAVIDAALPTDPHAPAAWPAYAVLLPHAHAALDLTSDGMGRIARYLGHSGHYPAARDICRQITDAHTAYDPHGPEHPRTLTARREAARWTGMAGQAAEARDQLTALLAVVERVQGPDHPETLATRHEMARWTGAAGDAADAREQCAALWPAVERVLGADHLDALALRSELARWTGQAPDTPDARDQCATVLSIYELIAGPSNADVELHRRMFPDVAGLEQATASARYQFGLLHRIYERLLGGEHPDTLAAWRSETSLAGDAGYAAHARTQFGYLLQRSERILGRDHPDTLHTRASLAHWTRRSAD